MGRTWGRGQAAVEWIGLALALALALAAVAAWLLPALRPPPAPPPLIDRIARPAAPAPADLGEIARRAMLDRLVLLRGPRGDRPIGRALGAAVRGVATGAVVLVEARHEFSTSFGRRLVQRLAAIARDPLSGVARPPDPRELGPTALARRGVARSGEARDYLRRLRSLPLRTAIRVASGDLGTLVADSAVDVLSAVVRRRLVRTLRRPAPPRQPTPPAPRDPGAPRP